MIKLSPAFKDYLWGGTKLKTEYAGKSLLEYVSEQGRSVLGTKCSLEDDMPILIKFIDAKDDLSIQVHPDNEYALKHEGDYGKTEMWYVLEAEEGAELIYGFNRDISKEEFKQAIQDNTLTQVINSVKVQTGDVFFIEPGMMHAIGKGIIIAEIQQRSNITYRIYDFGRVGIDGKPRELHIDKALDVTTLSKADKPKVEYILKPYSGYSRGVLASCEYFHVEVIEISSSVELHVDETTFNSILVVEGSGSIGQAKEALKIVKGDSIFLPAGYGRYCVSGECKVILSKLA